MDGYRLVGSSCVSEKVVSFMFKIDVSLDDFDSDTYSKLVQELA